MNVFLIKEWIRPNNRGIVEAGKEVQIENDVGRELINQGIAIKIPGNDELEKKEIIEGCKY